MDSFHAGEVRLPGGPSGELQRILRDIARVKALPHPKHSPDRAALSARLGRSMRPAENSMSGFRVFWLGVERLIPTQSKAFAFFPNPKPLG